MKKRFKILIVFVLSLTCSIGYFEKFNLVDRYGLYLVQSDSMSPEVVKGDILFSQKRELYKVGDIVTFHYPYDMKNLISHRISAFSIEEDVAGNLHTYYKTKGDANSFDDPWRIKESAIKGKVLFSVPYFGYLLFLIRNPIGYLFLILAFSILIISESNDLFLETLRWYKSLYSFAGIKIIKIKHWYISFYEKVFERE